MPAGSVGVLGVNVRASPTDCCRLFLPARILVINKSLLSARISTENRSGPVDRSMSTRIMIATEPDWIRSAIAKHREWIESVQGVTIGKMAVLRVDNNFASFAARQILRDVRLTKLQQGPT